MKAFNLIVVLFVVLVAQLPCLECHKRPRRHHHHRTMHYRGHHHKKLAHRVEWKGLVQNSFEGHLAYKSHEVGHHSKKSIIGKIHDGQQIEKKRLKSKEDLDETFAKKQELSKEGGFIDRKLRNRNKTLKRRNHHKTTKKYELAYPPNNMQSIQSTNPSYGIGGIGGTQGQGYMLPGATGVSNVGGSDSSHAEYGSTNTNTMSQFTNQQLGRYQSVGNQGSTAAYASNNGDQNPNDDAQSARILQALEAQRKAVAEQQGVQQDGDQRAGAGDQMAVNQGTQGSEEQQGQDGLAGGVQQTNDQADLGRLQQNGDQVVASQQQQNDDQGGLMQQQGDQGVGYQGGEVGGETQGQEQGGMLQQDGSRQGTEMQQGEEQVGVMQQGIDHEGNGFMQGEQTSNIQQGTDQSTGYPQNSDQGGGAEEKDMSQALEGGTLSSLLAGGGQESAQESETAKIADESQGITSSDAEQLQAAIANANKGITTNDDNQLSLSKLASSSANMLGYDNGRPNDHGLPSEDLYNMGSVTSPGRVTTSEANNEGAQAGFGGNQDSELPSYNSQMSGNTDNNGVGIGDTSQLTELGDQNLLNFDGSLSLHHHHRYNSGGVGTLGEDTVHMDHDTHVGHLGLHLRPSSARYCAGCPRNAHCVDKVCIINEDEPLAKILAALSGPENETGDCNGCHHNAKCVKKECICKPGFSGDGESCRADSCLAGCNKHGKCIRGFCVCDHHHYFNGAGCAPYKISHRPCPGKCAKNCSYDCPDKCCEVHDMPKPTSAPHSAVTTENVATFYLKPTHHAIHETVSQQNDAKQENQTKQEPLLPPSESFTIGGLPAKPIIISKPILPKNNTISKLILQKNDTISKPILPKNDTISKPILPKNDTIYKPIPPDNTAKPDIIVTKPVGPKPCSAECSSARCGPSCPIHCCQSNNLAPIANPTGHQLEVLKTFAKKFCPESCQTKCTSTCPPICCDSRSLISLLQNAAGGSEVDLTKTEDLFRNAMSWFGMMNFLNMMYNMNPETLAAHAQYKPTAKFVMPDVTSSKSTVCPSQCVKSCIIMCPVHCCPANPTVARSDTLHCEASCRSHCAPSCPTKCCASLLKAVQPTTETLHRIYPKIHTRSDNVAAPVTTPKAPAAIMHTAEQCSNSCAARCEKSCPARCCTAHVKAPVRPAVAKASCPRGCEQHCSTACAPECCNTDKAVRPTARSQHPSSSPDSFRACTTGCPRLCYPSCSKECCAGAEESFKQQASSKHGQYIVSIRCPVECRPYNCLSYCHHECCLRDDSAYMLMKSSIAKNVRAKYSKAASIEAAKRAEAMKRYNDFHIRAKPKSAQKRLQSVRRPYPYTSDKSRSG